MNDAASLYKIRQVMLEGNDFVLEAHVNPDSDAVGACLALGLCLKKLGKRVHVVLDSYHEKNCIIPGQELVWKDKTAGPAASVLVVLDCASAERVSDPFSYMERAAAVVCIDHHLSHDQFARYMYLDSEASSTCELIYRIMAPIVDLDADIASAIYAGVMTDTGGFRHGCTGPGTLRVTAELVGFGIPFTNLYNKLLKRHSFTETLVMRAALDNLKLLNGGRFAFAFVSSEEMEAISAEITDTDGVSEYMLNITDVEVSVFLYEKIKDEVKASMRSTELNLSDIAKTFGGGGHKHAAGCTINAPLAEASRRITAAVGGALAAI